MRKPQWRSSALAPEKAQLAAKASRKRASRVVMPSEVATWPARLGSSTVSSSMPTATKIATAPSRRRESP